MFREFLIWWARQMLDLISWRGSRDGTRGKRLIVAVLTPLDSVTPTVELLLGARGLEHSLGVFPLSETDDAGFRETVRRREKGTSALALRLPPGVLLERQVVLPLLAGRMPERMLEYEMDRLTPFSAGELLWNWNVERRDRARGEMLLQLCFVTRASVRLVLAALERAGVTPAILETPAMGGEDARRIDLRRAALGAAGRGQWGLMAMGGLCALLMAAAIGLPFVQQSLARRAVEARFTALRPAVARAETLRREIAARASGGDVLAAEEAHMGNALEILATLTGLLPDDAHLTELTLRQKKLMLNGQSAAAARLIVTLSANPMLRDPTFAAPVVRVENGQADLFSIRAEIAP